MVDSLLVVSMVELLTLINSDCATETKWGLGLDLADRPKVNLNKYSIVSYVLHPFHSIQPSSTPTKQPQHNRICLDEADTLAYTSTDQLRWKTVLYDWYHRLQSSALYFVSTHPQAVE